MIDENSFYCYIQCSTNLTLPIKIEISGLDPSYPETVYTVNYGEVDSSYIMTYRFLDETYAKKTDLETLKTTIEELTARIAALEG